MQKTASVSSAHTENDTNATPNKDINPPNASFPFASNSSQPDSLNPFHFPKFDDYEVVQELHDGFFGPTALLRHRNSNSPYVVKTFYRSYLGTPERVRSLLHRNNMIRSYNFVFITSFTRVIETDNAIFMIRPYVDYPNLNEFLARTHMDNKKIYALWKTIAQCFVYLHDSGIYPNPIKPTNIFIVEGKYVALTDLYEITSDLSVALKTPSIDQIQLLAPEFFNNNEIIPGAPADVWSLGGLLLLMCGYPLPWMTKHVFSMIRLINEEELEFDQSMPYELLHVAKSSMIFDPQMRPTIPILLLPCLPPGVDSKKKHMQSMKTLKHSGKNILVSTNIHSAASIHSSAQRLLPKNCSFRCRMAMPDVKCASINQSCITQRCPQPIGMSASSSSDVSQSMMTSSESEPDY